MKAVDLVPMQKKNRYKNRQINFRANIAKIRR